MLYACDAFPMVEQVLKAASLGMCEYYLTLGESCSKRLGL